MKTQIVLLGVLIFFAGLALAYSNPYPYSVSVPTYPTAIDGAIVVLVGLVTIIIGFSIPEETTRQTEPRRAKSN